MADETPIPHMIAQVFETLKDKQGDYNVNGIVREIIEAWGQCDIHKVAQGRSREYWAIVRMHDMAEPEPQSALRSLRYATWVRGDDHHE